MITTAVVLLALLLLSIATLLSIFEMSLSRLSKVTVRRLIEKHRSKALEQLKILADNRLEGLVSVYVSIQVCIVGFAILITGYLHLAVSLRWAKNSTRWEMVISCGSLTWCSAR